MKVRLADGTELPPTLDGRQTAELFGCSYWSILDQAKAGTCPVQPLKLGRKLRWSTVAVLRVLGVEPMSSETGGHHSPASPTITLTPTAPQRGEVDGAP